MFALFLACGLAFYSLTASAAALQGFQAMYYISSFFAQFVNATTFLLVSQLCALYLARPAAYSQSLGHLR